MGASSTGTITVLFADTEGSTKLWRRFPQPMKAALARHDELVRSAIGTAGDGDYFGPSSKRVGRIRDAANGGQTLLSHPVVQLARGEPGIAPAEGSPVMLRDPAGQSGYPPALRILAARSTPRATRGDVHIGRAVPACPPADLGR